MTARSQLRDLIQDKAPDTWELYPHPVNLAPLDDPAKPVAIVIEQRSVTAGAFSPDGNGITLAVELSAWVIVDGSLGDDLDVVEDRLEEAVETMIRILEPLPGHVWDGTANRDTYDDQKPAYTFTIRAAGALTTEETE